MLLVTHPGQPKKVIASIRGVNLGGWLVLEEWLCPSLFESFPPSAEELFHDGCRFQLQTVFGKWVSAEDGGGSEIVGDRTVADQWETFTACFVAPNQVNMF